jgi:hypothetical protein
MTSASDGVAVVATQLARTDRRALSEAWYSALHVARGAAAAVRPHASQPRVQASLPAARAHTSPPRAIARPAAPPLPRAQRERGTHVPPGSERRRPVSETGRRIERAVERLAWLRRMPAAQTIDVDGGRIRLLLHHDGTTTRIVALCSRPLREQVERALASARFALAGAGVAVAP